VVARFLSKGEAAPVLADLAEVYREHGEQACFPWGRLAELGAWNVQDLAIPADDDGPKLRLTLRDVRVRTVPLAQSQLNWRSGLGDCPVAEQLHRVALRHRLVVHCA
jgi:hypothetical protein